MWISVFQDKVWETICECTRGNLFEYGSTMLENILCVRDVYRKWCFKHSPFWDHLGLLAEFDEHISEVKRDIQRVEVLKERLQAAIRLVCSV